MSSQNKIFDYAIIGSGSGLDIANSLANDGHKVAIIEKGRPGGTCLNRGCIPSKFLIHSADVCETVKHASNFGIKTNNDSVDYSKITNRTKKFTDSHASDLLEGLKNQTNPMFFHNTAKFIDENTLKVGQSEISSSKFIIACGSRPRIPEIKGLDSCDFLTSDTAIRLNKKPESLTIIGGGYIGCELAHFFGTLGVKINLIHKHKLLLNHEDIDISKKFTDIVNKKYNVFTNFSLKEIIQNNGECIVKGSNSNEIMKISSEKILVCVGRIPNTDTLALEKTGVKTDKKNHVVVDRFLESTKRGIYALGDVLKEQPFKHAANYEAECLYKTLKNVPTKVDYTIMPHAVFTSPQIASVGKTEQNLQNEKIKYKKIIHSYEDSAMGMIIDDHSGFVKLLIDEKQEKILGAHIVGSNASILIHELIVAMNTDNPIKILKKSIHIHPALSEVISRAISRIS